MLDAEGNIDAEGNWIVNNALCEGIDPAKLAVTVTAPQFSPCLRRGLNKHLQAHSCRGRSNQIWR
jgi:hypothetical protein